jgi:hypothetical protein
MAAPTTVQVGTHRPQGLAAVPTQRCPRLGQLSCQRSDDHARGHVYHGAWAPDRHDAQD